MLMDDVTHARHDALDVTGPALIRDGRSDMTDFVKTWSDLVMHSPLALVLVLGEQHILGSMNAAFEHLCKTEARSVLHRSFRDGFPQAAASGVGTVLDRVLATGEPEIVVIEEHVVTGDEPGYWTYTVWPIRDQHQRRVGLILHLQDTTGQMMTRRHADQVAANLRMVNEQLLLAGLREQALAESAMQDALHDSLTGLPNRSLLLDRLAQSFPTIQRVPRPHALFMLDVDRFKAVNDNFGHPTGDQLLMQIARRLLMSVRPEDTVARIGGDEFAILLMEGTKIDEVMHIADRIQEQLSKPFDINGHIVKTTASIGIVHSSPTYQHADDMLKDADIALYEAKALGKGRSVVFDASMQAQLMGQRQVENELRSAIEHDELRLHYQPIISLANGMLIGVEALVRWQHPQRGLLQPQDFLAVAEDTGLIIPLGEWVLRAACAQAYEWQLSHNLPMYVAVNLSARHLKQHTLSTTVSTILHQMSLTPALLHLELTEGTVMEDVVANIALLEQLTGLGIHLSIDDFGTGYSSLSYLKRLPFTTVKIDRSFIQDITDDANDAAIVAAIISMAHRLGLQVIAEGVETEAQLAYIRAEGCDAVQGFLLGRPQSATEITERLGTKNWLPSRAP